MRPAPRRAARILAAVAAAWLAFAAGAWAQDADPDDEDAVRGDTPRIVKLREDYAKAGAAATPRRAIAAAWLGLALMQQRRFAEAEPLFQEQRDVFRQRFGAEDPRTAQAIHNLGLLYRRWGRIPDAMPLLEEALAIRRKRLQPGDVNIAWTLTALGECRLIAGRPAEAEALQREAVAIFERTEGPRGLGLATGLIVLADVLSRTANADEAATLARRAAEIREGAKGPDWPPAIAARRVQALYLVRQAKLAEGEALAREVLRRSEARAPNTPLDAFANSTLGHALQAQARYADAEPHFRKALTILERSYGPDSIQAAEMLRNLGENLDRRGRAADALPLFARDLAIVSKLYGPDHPQTATALIWVGNTQRRLGRNDLAEPAVRRALVIRERVYGAENRNTAQSRLNVALVLMALGKPAEAEPLLARAVASIAAADGADSPFLARPMYSLGRAQRLLKRQPEAEASFRRAIDLMQRGWAPDDEMLGWSWNQLAILTFETRRGDESLDAIRRASAVFRSRAERLRARPGAGGEIDSEELSSRENFYWHLTIALAARTRALAAGDAAKAAALADEAFVALQLARATGTEAAVARMAARFAAGNDALARAVRTREELLERRKRVDARLLAAAGSEDQQRDRPGERAQRAEIAELDGRIAEADRRLGAEFPEYVGLVAVHPQTIAEVQKLLAPGEVMVAWLTSTAWTNIFAIAADRVEIGRTEGGHRVVVEAVTKLRRGLDPRFIGADGRLPTFDAAGAAALYDRLFKPVEPMLAGAKLVYVVPDRALQSLPVAVLLTGPPPGPVGDMAGYAALPWLAARHATAVLPSVSSLRSLRRFAKASAAPEPFLGVGDPALDGARGATRGIVAAKLFASALGDPAAIRALPPLPDTANELRAIARTLKTDDQRVWLRKRATEAAVRGTDLTRYRVLSFATHGLMAGEFGDVGEPALVLTPPAKATAADDGLLTASEITALRLDADWVLLSACNTAAPDGTPGAEGLSGLARAFFYAGSRSLLVSHWSVASDAAVKLTTGIFAAAQKDPGIGRAEAHRRSMVALMTDRSGPYNAHPMFWAPFVVVGEGAAAAR